MKILLFIFLLVNGEGRRKDHEKRTKTEKGELKTKKLQELFDSNYCIYKKDLLNLKSLISKSLS